MLERVISSPSGVQRVQGPDTDVARSLRQAMSLKQVAEADCGLLMMNEVLQFPRLEWSSRSNCVMSGMLLSTLGRRPQREVQERPRPPCEGRRS